MAQVFDQFTGGPVEVPRASEVVDVKLAGEDHSQAVTEERRATIRVFAMRVRLRTSP